MKALASVFMVLVGGVMDAFSDVYFRVGGHDHVNGTDAHAWDVVSTIIIVAGLLGFAASVLFDD
jgi:hypothetical protein